MEYYLVKWKGWPDSTNTWEPLQNLKCPLLLQQFSNDKHNYLSQVKKGKAVTLKENHRALKPAVAEYIVKKAKQRIALQRWQDELNRRKTHKGMIFVENTVDLEGPPSDFYYINEYKPAPGISLVNEATFGCSCTDCFFEKCCPAEAGVLLAYNKNQQIKIPPGTPIYECNSRCQCGPDCPNRIVQKGTQYSLCIFRTSNGCGWGVKTLVKIKRMSFVMEYVGEVRSPSLIADNVQGRFMLLKSCLFNLRDKHLVCFDNCCKYVQISGLKEGFTGIIKNINLNMNQKINDKCSSHLSTNTQS